MAQIDAGLAVVSRYRFLEQGGDPANPAAGHGYLYCKPDGIYLKQDDGTVVGPLGAPYTEGARVKNSGDQTIAHATDVELDWDTEDWDTDGIHDAGDPERLTCKTAGKYFYWCILNYDGDSTGYRQARLYVDGFGTGILTAVSKFINLGAADTTYVVLSGAIELAVNEYLSIVAFRKAGTTLDVNSAF